MVSVIIPTYNRASTVGDAVRSALAQSYSAKEVLVVDDGSTDRTSTTLAQFPGIRVLRQGNAGPSAARNHGMRLATGDFLAFLDSDDMWDPGFLSVCVRYLEEHAAGFVFANWRTSTVDGELLCADGLRDYGYMTHLLGGRTGADLLLPNGESRHLFLRHSPAPSSSLLVKRAVIEDGWCEDFRIGEDNMFVLDILLSSGCACGIVTPPLWTKRVGAANICHTNADFGRVAQEHVRMQEALLLKYSDTFTLEERRAVHSTIATDLFDWGYSEAHTGRPWSGGGRYLLSLSHQPRLGTLTALLKALLHAVCRAPRFARPRATRVPRGGPKSQAGRPPTRGSPAP